MKRLAPTGPGRRPDRAGDRTEPATGVVQRPGRMPGMVLTSAAGGEA